MCLQCSGFFEVSIFLWFLFERLIYWIYVRFSFEILEMSSEYDKNKNIYDIDSGAVV